MFYIIDLQLELHPLVYSNYFTSGKFYRGTHCITFLLICERLLSPLVFVDLTTSLEVLPLDFQKKDCQ